jgi:hypothetical protein
MEVIWCLVAFDRKNTSKLFTYSSMMQLTDALLVLSLTDEYTRFNIFQDTKLIPQNGEIE